MAKLSGVGIVALAGGGLLLYSAINGKRFSSSVRSVLSGQSPSGASGANPITDSAVGTTASSGSSGSAAVIAPSGPSETAWITAMLASIGAPPTQANISSISSWIAHEGPYGTQGENNPLNTTIETTGAQGKFLNTPVTNYDTPAHGIAAIAQTLLGGGYSDILSALRSGNGLCGRSWSGLSTWSGGGYSRVC